MITAKEARTLVETTEVGAQYTLHDAFREALDEIDNLIKLKAADGGQEIVYSFKSDRSLLSDAVRTSLKENGYRVATESNSNSIRIVW